MEIDKTLSYTILFGLLLVLFVPFIIANYQLFPFITGKGFTFRIGVEVLLALWVVLFLRNKAYMPRFSWIMGSLLIFTGIIGIADAFGLNPYKSFWSNYERMEGYISILHLLAYFFIASSILNSEKRWNVFLNTSVVSSVIMAIYGLLQLAGKFAINQGGVRVDGTFGNATYLAVFMLINVFISLFLLFRAKGENIWLKRSAYIVAIIFQTIILYNTATRGAILGLIGGALVTAVLIALFGKNWPGFRKTAIIGLVGILVVIGGFFAVRNTQFVQESKTLSRFATLSVEELKTQGRRYVWPMAIQGFKERPILGWGQENFSYVFNKYYDPRMYNQEPWFDRTHNIFLDWLIVGGILGLLGYLSIYFFLLWYAWRGKHQLSFIDKSILTGLIAGYFFQNLFVFDNLISYIYFFSILAYIHSQSVQQKSPPNWLAKLSSANTGIQSAAALVLVILLAVGIYFLNVKPILANRTLLEAIDPNRSTPEQTIERMQKVFEYNTFGSPEAREQLVSIFSRYSDSSISTELKQKYVDLTREQFEIQTTETPQDTRYLLFGGSVLSRFGDFEKAKEYLQKAHETSPKKQNILLELGLSYMTSGDLKGGLEQFKKAYEIEPSNPEARVFYAIAAIYSNNTALVNELLAPLDERTVVTDDRIISAYATSGKLPEAIILLERRLKYDASLQTYFSIAAAYLQANQRTKSIEVLKTASNLFPQNKEQIDFYISEIQAGRNP